ncbi:MAG: PilZ domain-containing protein [Nitrospirae bacterium]|nr:PilZ domain-containing protein [Nitrospirota bacterium]
MKDKRRHKRFSVDDLAITGKMIFDTEVKIVNISISGVSLLVERRMEIGSEYTLRLEDKGRSFSARGIVVWSSMDGTRTGPKGDSIPVYKAGIKFADVLNDNILELIQFIERHRRGEEHRLSGLRFHIKAPEKAILNFPAIYKVKKLSLGGMLIESTQPLEVETKYPMEITTPEDTPIHFLGRVASCLLRKHDGVGFYDIGIEFMEMPEQDQERFNGFMSFLQDIDKQSQDL